MLTAQKIKVIFLAVILIWLPQVVFAQQVCKKDGYTISTINGVFTDEEGARNNQRALFLELGGVYHGEKIDYHYLLNPSHIAGLGDFVMSVYQKAFENETVKDYDLIEMLNDASAKVQTQKLLLVAHSQGNFYANSFYDVVAGQVGGLPTQSIGVYSVASPASRVAGGGKWITSDTDHVIAGLVSYLAPFHAIMPPNTHISEVAGGLDPLSGHDFALVYLKYRPTEIIADIQSSLDKLSSDPERREDTKCIDPPKLSFLHKAEGVILAFIDPKAVIIKDATTQTFNTGVSIASAVVQTTATVASNLYTAVATVFYVTGNLAGNSATVILATQNPQVSSLVNTINSNQILVPLTPKVTNQSALSSIVSQQSPTITPTTVSKVEVRPPTLPASPKLVFVGSSSLGLGGGGGTSPVVLGFSSEALIEEEVGSSAGAALATPALSVPQCSYSLATDGCLLSTTKVRFEWPAVEKADFYAVNKNGEYSTTTQTTHDITVKDFSDYTFEVSAVGGDGSTSATSTKKVSVASIPIAINEIAWMGTNASPSDEWLELKNNTGHTIDLTQWALEAKDGKPFIKLTGSIAPREYRILERRSDAVVANISAGQIYGNGGSQWALGNSGEELILSYASSTMDSTPLDIWVAGSNETGAKKTMERISTKESGSSITNWATWGNNIDFIKDGKDSVGDEILGTPGARNSVSYQSLNNGEDIMNNFTLSSDTGYYASTTLLVSASSTLIIKEGVDVSLYQGGLWINGRLVAEGTVDNPIVFNTFSDTHTINDLVFKNSTGTSTLDYVVLENTGGIVLNNAQLEVRNSNFINNDTGLELYNKSTALIENTHFASTTKEVISAYNGSTVLVASSTITNTIDADAVSTYNSTLTVRDTVIDKVYDGEGIGSYYSTVSIENSSIKNIYDGDGISIYNSQASITNSNIENINSGDGIGAYNSQISTASSTVKKIEDGYGIFLYNSASAVINTTVEDGIYDGIAVYGGTAKIEDSTISGFTEGAGIYARDPISPVEVSNTVFSDNRTDIESLPDKAIVVTP